MKTKLDGEALVGMEKQLALDLCYDQGITVRIASVNGRPNILTRDYHTDRLNIDIMNGLVSKIYWG